VIAEKYQKEDILTYQKELSTYQFTFQKIGDEYIFSSIKEK